MTDPYLGQHTLMRAFLDAILPPGSLWQPAPGGAEDHLLDGISDSWQGVHDDLAKLAHLRDPWRTPYLDDLERDFGILPDTNLSEAQRRSTLAVKKYQRNQKSTLASMQAALDTAGLGTGGYGLHVYANDPPVDPETFMDHGFLTQCGEPEAVCGYFSGAGIPAASWRGAAHNGTVFCTISADGYAATSVNGTTWTLNPAFQIMPGAPSSRSAAASARSPATATAPRPQTMA